MRTIVEWIVGVAIAAAVSSGIVLVMLWSYTKAGGWVVEVTSPTIVFPLMALLAVIQAATSAAALVIQRRRGIPAALTAPVLAMAVTFGYISALIMLANPTGRGYHDSLAYAKTEILALVAAMGAGGAIAGLVYTRGRPKGAEDVSPVNDGEAATVEVNRPECCSILSILIRWTRKRREG